MASIRSALALSLGAMCVAAAPQWSSAQTAAYPAKPIRIIVTSEPSTGPDVIARLVGQKLIAAWGQQVVVDDRAGATGNIGAEIAARAAADGYTLMMATSQHAIGAALFGKLNYDLAKDFAPITLLATTPFVLVVALSVPATSVQELVAFAKSRPAELRYGSSGTGGTPHLAAEMFKTLTGTQMLHVPYKGASAPITATMSGEVQVTFSAVLAVSPALKLGKVRALAVTGLKRTSLAGNLPAIAETVPGYEIMGWYGLVARAGTPDAIVAKLTAALVRAVRAADFRERLSSLGAEPMGTSSREFGAFIVTEIEKMRKTVKAAGARPDGR